MRLTTRDLAHTALCTTLIAVGAFATVPLGPVPFTLQPLFVLLAGLLLGARLGTLSVIAYLVLGLIAPVYAGGASGLGVLAGPTGGYLVGFIGAAAVAGALRGSPQARTLRLTGAAIAGLIPIYVIGPLWLAVSLQTTDPRVVLIGGVAQFLPLDLLKAVMAAVVTARLVRFPVRFHERSQDH